MHHSGLMSWVAFCHFSVLLPKFTYISVLIFLVKIMKNDTFQYWPKFHKISSFNMQFPQQIIENCMTLVRPVFDMEIANYRAPFWHTTWTPSNVDWGWIVLHQTVSMMTSSNGNIFRITGHLCGEFTSNRWIPRTKASDAELWCFLWSVPE